MVYNNAKGTVNDANLDAETIQSFNSKFTAYCGSNKSASEVNSLIELLNTNNATAANSNNAAVINLTATATSYSGTTPTTGATQFNIVYNNSQRYTVTYTTGADGFINMITIQ